MSDKDKPSSERPGSGERTQKFSEKRGYGVQTSPASDRVPGPPRSQATTSSSGQGSSNGGGADSADGGSSD